ncbi:DUF2924 domain-containing protein [Wolbachia endosymbiont of Atemnus politus]|uniref:DUF2924 domain-containing protein n=1 Tax=Wolbachia endosymbiont of Atemnus politus TaxID=2682840 RepID=UPI002107DB95|nr:DUF2924 domain-containing protein [Wolbachia endosymbiont of Atemnus politus]
MEKRIKKEVLNLEGKKRVGRAEENMERSIWGRSTSKKYLIPRLAYRIQEEACGEMSRKSAKRLKYLFERLEKGKRISSDKLPVAGT